MRRLNAMFSDGHNESMYKRKGMRRETDIGGGNRWRSLLCISCCGYADPRGTLDIKFLRHVEERSYV